MTTYSPAPAAAGTRTASGPLGRWRVVDLVTAAVLGVAFGALFLLWNQVYAVASPAFAGLPPLSGLLAGLYFLPAVVGGLVVRRPGAALFVELVAAFAEMVFGNQWGASVMVSGLVQGLGVEAVLLLVAYRRFGPVVAAAAGTGAAVLEIVGYEWWTYYADQPWNFRLLYLACTVVSGAVIAGLGGWALVRALAGTGALSAFPPGVERADRDPA